MNWIILAIIAPMLWAFNNVIDKISMGKYIKNPTSYLTLILISNLFPLPIFFFLLHPTSFSKWALFSILLGIIQGTSFLFYIKAMKMEEVSRVTPILTITPIFTLPLAFLFLGEKLKLLNYLGILLMVIAGILINYKKSNIKKPLLSPAIYLTLSTTFVVAVTGVLSKNILNYMDHWTFVFWITVGFLIGGLLLLLSKRNRENFWKDVKENENKPVIFFRLVGIVFYYTALILFYKSLSVGTISVIVALGSVQPFFVLLYAIILTKLKPEFLKEEMDKQTISLKFLSIVMIIIGTYLTIL